MLNRAYRYRLYPTREQEARLRSYADAARFIYNLALEQRRDWWRQFKAATGTRISLPSQSRELTPLLKDCEWLRVPPRSALEYALKDVERAFGVFWRGGGYPSFRTKDRDACFSVKGIDTKWRRVNAKWGSLRLPKTDDIKFRCTRDVIGRVKMITVKCVAGKWFASIVTDDDMAAPIPFPKAVGIDRGVANSLALSTGEMRSLPASIRAAKEAHNRAQRALSRCVKGSRRRQTQKAAAARLSARVANMRSHWLHEQSTEIAGRFGAVAIEALQTANMTKSGKGKRGLNRSILEQGWRKFADMLDYKLAARGGVLHLVNPAYTSQTCSDCGCVAKESRKSQSTFECVDCGHVAHADVNAAINILRRSPACVEGRGYAPDEARPGEPLTRLENLAA